MQNKYFISQADIEICFNNGFKDFGTVTRTLSPRFTTQNYKFEAGTELKFQLGKDNMPPRLSPEISVI